MFRLLQLHIRLKNERQIVTTTHKSHAFLINRYSHHQRSSIEGGYRRLAVQPS